MATATKSPPPEVDDEDDAPGFLTRHRVKIALAAAVAVAAGGWMLFKDQKPPKRKAEVRMVDIMPPAPPPPPTPPPPTPPPPPPEEKPPEFEPEAEPEEKPPEPETQPEPAEAPLGTNIEGSEDDGFGLGKGGGNGFGKGLGGGGSRSKYGWYAGKVQAVVVDALRKHRATRSAALAVTVRIWADGSGRIVRATLAGSSGNAATDSALRDQILTGLQLPEPPPAGMPMPIVMRITGKRPN